jgi:hypothetical protein
VDASGSASVRAYDSASVDAYGSASVRAYASAMVDAYDSASVSASGSAKVDAYGSASVSASGSASVLIPEKDRYGWSNAFKDQNLKLGDNACAVDRRGGGAPKFKTAK